VRFWPVWLVLSAPAAGAALAAVGRRPSWRRGIGTAVTAGLLATAWCVWWVGRQGLQVDLRSTPPGAPLAVPPARLGARDYLVVLGSVVPYTLPYALAVGAVATWLARAVTRPRP